LCLASVSKERGLGFPGIGVEASALRHQAAPLALGGRSPLLRLQGDEKLIALVRDGNSAAFEALVQRYQPRLLAFCRHMLSSTEDAEDVLQEVFAASYNALLADNRPINARPWLYRIARNRCLNQLRKPKASGQDSMDIFERDNGATTAETVHRREEFRDIVSDVGELPETQRTALLLREIDALSYDQIAEAMDTTIPSIKSLLVRARVSLAEASEARLLTCEEVRTELGEVAEGLARTTPPVRRHLKTCVRCRTFRTELRRTSKALAAVFPIGPFLILKKLGIAKLGLSGGSAAGSSTAAGGGLAGGAGLATGGAAAGGAAAGGMLSAGVGTIASKAVAGMAAAVIVTAGAAEVRHVASAPARSPVAVSAPQVRSAPAKPAVTPERQVAAVQAPAAAQAAAAQAAIEAPAPAKPAAPAPATEPEAVPGTEPEPEPAEPLTPPVQEEESSTVLPPRTDPEVGEEDPAAVVEDGDLGQTPLPPAPPAGEPPASHLTPPPPPPGS